MKGTISILTMACMLAMGCEEPNSVALMVLSDRTDAHIPRPKMGDVLHFMGEGNGPRYFHFRTIANTSVNALYTAELGAGTLWENKLDRKRKVAALHERIEGLLDENRAKTGTYGNSSILTPLISGMERLHALEANRKVLLLYSDCLEASDLFNVYGTDRGLLLKDPKAVATRLESTLEVPRLDSVELYIVHYPKDMADDRLFARMVEVLGELFRESGLKMDIGIPNTITDTP